MTFDWKMRAGYLQKVIPLQFPVTLGGDIAGVVAEIGKDVTNFRVGDKVFGQAYVISGGSGAFAEYATTNAQQLAKMPMNLDFTEAAALPLTGVSAMQVIEDHIKLKLDQKILIHGGAGGIGSIAIQIAKHTGAYVATTASAKSVVYVKGLGADEIIDYKSQKFEEIIKEFDAVFDTVGKETYTKSFGVLKKGGILVSMIEQPNKELAKQHGVTAIIQHTSMTTESLNRLTKLVEDGVIKVHIDTTYPLNKIQEAFRKAESGGVHGKVVIK